MKAICRAWIKDTDIYSRTISLIYDYLYLKVDISIYIENESEESDTRI